MTSNSESNESHLQDALTQLLQSNLPFVLMVEQTHGNLTYYSNTKGDRLVGVSKQEE